MLRINEGRYRYKKHKNDVAVDMEFNLTLPKTNIMAVLGDSGAGKSTLLNVIAGLLPLNKGSIYIDGYNMENVSPENRPVSYIFQDNNLFPHMNVFKNIALGINPALTLLQSQEQLVLDTAHECGIKACLHRLPEQLSGGQKQRVALARSIVRNKPLLLLDEPFSALDPASRKALLNKVKELSEAQCTTVLMVTHRPEDAIQIADQCAFVDRGNISVVDRTQSFFSKVENPALNNYLGNR